MSNPKTEPEVRDFFDAWSVYDQVLDRNYMYHDELYQEVQGFLVGRYAERPLSILDLGCGSARHLARALDGLRVSRYLGYDLSEAALAQAGVNLAGLGDQKELRQGDLLDGLKSNTEKFELIFSSFALHHLVSEDKSDFFRLACEGLQAHGILLIIDVMRDENEELALYLDRYCGWLRAEWNAMTPEALDSICEHVRGNDYPETASELYAMAARAGFSGVTEIRRYLWHRIVCFQK